MLNTNLTKWSVVSTIVVTFTLVCGIDALSAQQEVRGRALLVEQAAKLRPLVTTPIARQFLESVNNLPEIDTRVVYYDKENRKALSEQQAAKLPADQLSAYQRMKIDEHYYYTTRYGTPLAFVRPLDLLAKRGMAKVDEKRIVDFGFGSIGQLRLLASLGADAAGIEVDRLLQTLYSAESDTGAIERVGAESADERVGKLRLYYGSFPSDAKINEQLGDGFDVFISKNTLKRGYIHPEREVDPKRLVQLGVDDETFVRAVFQRLKPGGFFMIYNLHPAPAAADEPYKPWADGRCPFARNLVKQIGFEVLTFDEDDTSFIREMGKALEWDGQMDLENDLFATFTLMRKPN